MVVVAILAVRASAEFSGFDFAQKLDSINSNVDDLPLNLAHRTTSTRGTEKADFTSSFAPKNVRTVTTQLYRPLGALAQPDQRSSRSIPAPHDFVVSREPALSSSIPRRHLQRDLGIRFFGCSWPVKR